MKLWTMPLICILFFLNKISEFRLLRSFLTPKMESQISQSHQISLSLFFKIINLQHNNCTFSNPGAGQSFIKNYSALHKSILNLILFLFVLSRGMHSRNSYWCTNHYQFSYPRTYNIGLFGSFSQEGTHLPIHHRLPIQRRRRKRRRNIFRLCHWRNSSRWNGQIGSRRHPWITALSSQHPFRSST